MKLHRFTNLDVAPPAVNDVVPSLAKQCKLLNKVVLLNIFPIERVSRRCELPCGIIILGDGVLNGL
jgi:hypothetical protein